MRKIVLNLALVVVFAVGLTAGFTVPPADAYIPPAEPKCIFIDYPPYYGWCCLGSYGEIFCF